MSTKIQTVPAAPATPKKPKRSKSQIIIDRLGDMKFDELNGLCSDLVTKKQGLAGLIGSLLEIEFKARSVKTQSPPQNTASQ